MANDNLTKRQAEILDLIRSYVAEEGCPPTRAEIAQALGFRSPNAAEDHLRALERKGVIELVPGSSRGIRLLEEITKEQLESFDPQNPVTKFDRNPRFHRILAEMTGNQVLMIIQEILMEIHSHSMNKKKMNQKTIQRITSQHQGIINALKKKDSKLAYERVKKHVMSVHEMHERLEDLNH